MGKILPKKKFFKSAIYTPHLDVGSHIDNVKYSLEHLIFSNTKEVEHTLLVKRIKVVALTTVLLMIIGSFLSPKGQAEVATFYPTACLGGWNNPRNAEGEPQVSVSGDASEFNIENSAMLAKETNADIYCGSFVGTIEQNTKPIKMVVSLSWSAKDILVHAKQVEETASSTESLIVGTSTASTTLLLASSTENSASTSDIVPVEIATTSQATSTEETPSTLEKVVDLVQDVLGKVFGGDETASTTVATSTPEVQNNAAASTTTETTPVAPVVESPAPTTQEQAPAPAVEAAPIEATPTSFLETIVQKIAGRLITKVFAEEISEVLKASSTSEEITTTIGTTSLATTTSASDNASSSLASSTDAIASSTPENTTNDFLEVLYTFDGVVWNSLGMVNESSIQYRTFEIPVTASTSWEDMGQLQIKVKPVQRIDEKPIVYLDGIKVEVLYETPLTHEHPDFLRDTILQDDVVKGVRILRIINNDTNKEEIWYMHPEEATSTQATSTLIVATSSEISNASTTEITPTDIHDVSSSTLATSTVTLATSTEDEVSRVIKPSFIKNKWMKLDSEEVAAKGVEALLKEIIEQEKKQEYMFPDFTKDIIKQIKGSFLNAVIVQVEQAGTSTLWLFDTEKDTQEKIDEDGKTTISKTFPFGMKGDNVFWLSEDGSIVFAYNVITKTIEQKEIPPHNESLGERGEVVFESVPWKVIVGADQFSFYSEATGEVFSDDNLTTSEVFRTKEKLDDLLDQDKIEDLNLIVTEPVQE